jgi:hypothetical protein
MEAFTFCTDWSIFVDGKWNQQHSDTRITNERRGMQDQVGAKQTLTSRAVTAASPKRRGTS